MRKKMMMHVSCIFLGMLLVAVGTAFGQDHPQWEATGEFSFTHTGSGIAPNGENCYGGGGTAQYNINSLWGVGTELSGCKIAGLSNAFGIGSKVSGNEFLYVFGPRLTFRQWGKIRPFAELNVGAVRVGVGCNTGNVGNACGALNASNLPGGLPTLPPGVVLPPGVTIVVPRNPTASGASYNAFAMTVGGGFDIKFNKTFAWRVVQAEYLYSRVGNGCRFAYCTGNNGQNSVRLNSGIVIGWGGQ